MAKPASQEMLPEIIERKGQAVTTSVKVAEYFGKRPADVIRAIENCEYSKEFTERNFALSEYKDSTGRKLPMYYMTRSGFSAIVLKFTGKRAAIFQEQYITAFERMEEYLSAIKANHHLEEWVKTRKEGITARKGETDVISRFIQYAIGQGSKSAHWYYKHITEATYKALFLIAQKHPSIRSILAVEQLSNLMCAERIVQRKLVQYMDEGIHYKKIFDLVKDDIVKFSEMIGKTRIEIPQQPAFKAQLELGF